jgi:acetyl/propionyl-CoA carboxylase alpha subunit
LALRRILIANRGEIAVRIIRTCRKLNIGTVLAASTADLDSVPAKLADRTICIIQVRGCAIECRVNAEDPSSDFRPSPGRVREVAWPCAEGIRVDTYIASGSRVPPFYDSLMAKIIAYAPDRAAALTRLRQAISSTRVAGVHTNLPFHEVALADPEFQAGGFDTGFVTRLLERSPLTMERARNG